jgi:predicted aconitase
MMCARNDRYVVNESEHSALPALAGRGPGSGIHRREYRPSGFTEEVRMATKATRRQWTAVGLAVGAGLGLTVGLLVSGGPAIGLGLALGAGVGIAIGASLDSKKTALRM